MVTRQSRNRRRDVRLSRFMGVAATSLALTAGALAPGAVASTVEPTRGLDASAAAAAAPNQDSQMLLVHGYGNYSAKRDCNGDTWKTALDAFQRDGGRDRATMSTIGYYQGDDQADHYGEGCDVILDHYNDRGKQEEDDGATNCRPIQDIARDLAHHIQNVNAGENGKPVTIVAHSMGGLISRVALLGSAKNWKGFPKGRLNVTDVVTLGTPHQGLRPGRADDRPKSEEGCENSDTTQWRQMDWDNPKSDFYEVLHHPENRLSEKWANDTDWTFVGADEDGTVSYNSAIDKGYFADQKVGYPGNSERCKDSHDVTHSNIRSRYSKGENTYCLKYWHYSENHDPHPTDKGWSPVETAWRAASNDGDDFPK